MVFCIFFSVISLFGSGISEVTPVMIISMSGGQLTINELEPGAYMVQIQNITPNVTVLSDSRSVRIPLALALPANSSTVAMNLMDNNGEMKTFLAKTGDIHFFKENQSLVFDIIPQEYYESTPLVSDKSIIHDIKPGIYSLTNVSFAYPIKTAENRAQSCCDIERWDSGKCHAALPLC